MARHNGDGFGRRLLLLGMCVLCGCDRRRRLEAGLEGFTMREQARTRTEQTGMQGNRTQGLQLPKNWMDHLANPGLVLLLQLTAYLLRSY